MDTNINNPIVSVIMPAYNAEIYIQEAIDSVVLQTFYSWELIIVDDGSTDTTAEIVAKNINKDSRIKYFYQQNKRQSRARNLGISHAKGKYIAFLDSDDICLTERFTKQVTFLEANSDVLVCGSWFNIIGSDRVIKLPEQYNTIKLAFLRGNCMANSSIMVRKQILDEFSLVFDESKEPAEDYDLWVRLAVRGRLHNLQEVLLNYRMHNAQLSKKYNSKQKQSTLETQRSLYNLLELDLLFQEQLVLDKLMNKGEGICFSDFDVFKRLQRKLLESNSKGFFDPVGFKKEILFLDKIVVKSCFLNLKKFNFKTYMEYLSIKKRLNFKLGVKDEFKLALKSLICFTTK